MQTLDRELLILKLRSVSKLMRKNLKMSSEKLIFLGINCHKPESSSKSR